jgi:thioredoxin-related protein
LYISIYTIAQDSIKGIHFEQGSSWQQVLAKAKAENKIIFLDCYTTWCAPCKQMEKNIYPQEKVGDFYNKNFVCIKVQMDQTSRDNEEIKSWYAQAKLLEKNYDVNAYPTFLFLNADGKALHRFAGGLTADKFIELGTDAMIPERQSYTLAAKYDPAKMDTAELKKVAVEYRYKSPKLSHNLVFAYLKQLSNKDFETEENRWFLNNFKDDPRINAIATDYINSIPEKELYTPNNVALLINQMQSSKDRGFRLFLKKTAIFDSVMNQIPSTRQQWFAKYYIDGIIQTEEVEPMIQKAKSLGKAIDWNLLFTTMKKKYGTEYAERNVLMAKVNETKGDEQMKSLIQLVEKYGLKMWNSFDINNYAWMVFESTDNKEYLKSALSWSAYAVMNCPHLYTANWMDTYANILYKLGYKNFAIQKEIDASMLDPNSKDIKSTLEKMRKDKPTWPTKPGN